MDKKQDRLDRAASVTLLLSVGEAYYIKLGMQSTANSPKTRLVRKKSRLELPSQALAERCLNRCSQKAK